MSTAILTHGLPIVRRLPPAEWAAAIERVPEDAREEVRAWLREEYRRWQSWSRYMAAR
jgi:hypothetical protein